MENARRSPDVATECEREQHSLQEHTRTVGCFPSRREEPDVCRVGCKGWVKDSERGVRKFERKRNEPATRSAGSALKKTPGNSEARRFLKIRGLEISGKVQQHENKG